MKKQSREISGMYSQYVPYAYVVREVAPQSAKLFPRGDRHTILENRTNHFEKGGTWAADGI